MCYLCQYYQPLDLIYLWFNGFIYDIFRIELVIKLKKLSNYDLLIGLMVELRSNRWRNKYIIYISLKYKIIIKEIKII